MYGDGKYWTMIAKANPKFNSSNLKVGDRLVIPPKSTGAASRAATDSGTRTGRSGLVVPAAGTGQKIYVVQKGDNGFWGVAQKVYGNGQYWQVIAKANPSAESGSLAVGQKLVIPELDAAARAGAAAGGARTPSAPTSRPPARRDVEDIGRRPRFD